METSEDILPRARELVRPACGPAAAIGQHRLGLGPLGALVQHRGPALRPQGDLVEGEEPGSPTCPPGSFWATSQRGTGAPDTGDPPSLPLSPSSGRWLGSR